MSTDLALLPATELVELYRAKKASIAPSSSAIPFVPPNSV